MAPDVITAAFSSSLLAPGAKAPKRVIQYLPPGIHEITAKVNGETATREVTVEAGVERAFQESLDAHKAEHVTPFIDYLHDGGRASGHPVKFAWDDARGLTLEVEWTSVGEATIASKELQYFSPEFLLSPEGRPLGLHPSNKSIGGLVSDPAFTSIESIAATRAATNHNTPNRPQSKMDFNKFVDQGIITAAQAEDPAQALELISLHVAASRAKDKDSAANIAVIKAEASAAEARAEVAAMRDTAADSFIAAAIKASKIKAEDKEVQADLRSMHLADVAQAQRFLDRMSPVNSGLDEPVKRAAASREASFVAEDENAPLYRQAKELVKANKASDISAAIRSLGSAAYEEHRTSLGLGSAAHELRSLASQALLQSVRNAN